MPPSARHDPLAGSNFRVELDGIQVARFAECHGLSSETEVILYREGGDRQVRLIPGLTKYSPITLKRGRKVTLWVAVVAGENRDQLLANARAAQADIARRFEGDDDATSDGSLTVSSQAAGIPVRPFVKAGSRQ